MNRAVVPILVTLLAAALVGLLDAHFHFAQMLRREQATETRELATQFLAEYLARRHAGKPALVLSNPFARRKGRPKEVYRFEEAGLRGLRKGFGEKNRLQAVIYPEILAEYRDNPDRAWIHPETTTPLSYLMAPDALDSAVSQHPGAELIVSLIGLPLNVTQTRAWQTPGTPQFALLLPDLRVVGDKAAIRLALKSQKLAALVLNKPGAPPEDRPLGKDLQAEFDQRFLLVTADNVDEYLRAYPQAF
jgi:hypothetical protein